MTQSTNYVVGIDVGSHSVGFAAIEIDPEGLPLRFLNALSLIHDSGIGPDGEKVAMTRLAQRGFARRARRLVARRTKRYKELNKWITQQGWPLIDLDEHQDPYHPWRVRAQLANEPISNAAEKNAMLSIAIRHMIRHRGWRNPFDPVESLLSHYQPSDHFERFIESAEKAVGITIKREITPAQVVALLLSHNEKVALRGPEGLFGGKLHQRDFATELHTIGQIQRLSRETVDDMIRHVFQAESPRGSARQRAGRDCLPGHTHLPRARKASLAFQQYRIVSVAANLRIADCASGARSLTVEEMAQVTDFLMVNPSKTEPTWDDVAKLLGVDRGDLQGTAILTAEGERVSGRPPVNVTDRRMQACKVKAASRWWAAASGQAREALIDFIELGESTLAVDEATSQVQELLATLTDEDLVTLLGVNLPAGRAAYSAASLNKLSEKMFADGVDMPEARLRCFGVSKDWLPPADPIGEPVGNPAVDRVTKAVARWLQAAEKQWGVPKSIIIEHVRDGFTSENTSRQIDRENNKRADFNNKQREEIKSLLQEGAADRKIRYSDIVRYRAVQRQNTQCAYCGTGITFNTCEMDHIIPRKGLGSNNRRENLVAACRRCNASKNNRIFSSWAQSRAIPEVSVDGVVQRMKHWTKDAAFDGKQWETFKKEMSARLTRTSEDPSLDARSMESVAWMATELHHRIKQYHKAQGNDLTVSVFRGQITAEARKASGIEKRLPYFSYDNKKSGKSRLDRRHHAIDAAVISLMRQSVCTTLVERMELREEQHMLRTNETWMTFKGQEKHQQVLYDKWLVAMEKLSELLIAAMTDDTIVVMENLRLRLGGFKAHDDNPSSFLRERIKDKDTKKVLSTTLWPTYTLGSEIPVDVIDRAATPALWCALTRHPDYSPKNGLARNPNRTIRVHGTLVEAQETLTFFPKKAPAISVNDGFAEIGGTVHHARIFQVTNAKGGATFYMMRVFTIDLLNHQREDLFSVDLPPQCVSRRYSHNKLRAALDDGSANYVGWLVVGDQLKFSNLNTGKDAIGKFLSIFKETNLWQVDGFPTVARLRLRPVMLAGEGLPLDNVDPAVSTFLSGRGWWPSIDVTFNSYRPEVIRRDTLGRPRRSSAKHLPVCWSPVS